MRRLAVVLLWGLLLLVVMPVGRVDAAPVGQSSDECDELNRVGLSLLRQANYLDALEQFEQAHTCYHKIGGRSGEGDSLNNIGGIYSSLGQYQAALNHYQQGLTIQQETGDRFGEGVSLNNIGFIYDRLGQYQTALDYLRQGLTISQEIGDRSGEGDSLNNIGGIYYDLGQYETALDYFQLGLTIRQEIDDRAGEGNSLTNIGGIYSRLGQYQAALDYFQQGLTIRQEIGDQVGEGDSLNNIAGIYYYLGQYEAALDYFQQGLSIRQEIGDRAGEGTSLNNIGGIYFHLGQYQAALNYFQQGLSISQEIGDRAGEGTLLNNIGDIYDSLGQYETALDYTQRGLSIRQEIGDRHGEGVSLHKIGGIYDSLGQHEAALDYTQQGLSIRQEIGDQAGEGGSLSNIGLIYYHLGQYEAALDYYQQGLSIRQEIGDRLGEGISLTSLGTIYYHLGQNDPALDYTQQGLSIMQEIGNRVGEGGSLYNIGFIYSRLGQYEAALDYYQQAIDVVESVRGEAGSEQGRAGFIAQYASLYRNTVDLLHQEGQYEQAFQAMEQGRARAFLDALATGQVRLQDDDAADLLAREQEVYAQRQAIRFALAEAKANNPDRVADLEQQLAEAEAAYEDVQEAIAARGAALAALVPGRSADTVLGVEQVQPLLDEQATLVSYYQLEDNILAFILTGDSFETVALDVDPAEVTQQINNFRDFANVTAAHPASAVELYEILIAPLRDKLPSTSSGQEPRPHLAIIPHQSLHYLPFAALTDGERHLIDDHILTILPSASALPFIQENVQQTAYSGSPSALIAGNPVTADYDTVASLATTRDLLGALPFAEKEAKAIAKLFGVAPLIGEAATETAVRERVSEANILHLAAHGKFNPVAPLNSLIALAPDNPKSKIENPQSADGWLTVGESYGLNLENTDLVVLSACETNLGDLSAGDELVGLTRALIFAGTPSVIASLWAVEDEATSLLMGRFYTHLKDGMGKAKALRQAQIEVREEYPNPYYWSGFVLSGDPGEIERGSTGAGEQGTAASSDESPAVVEDGASVEDEAAASVEAGEGQSSGGCISLLLILGAMGAVVVIQKRFHQKIEC